MPMTNTAMKLLRWLHTYAQLMQWVQHPIVCRLSVVRSSFHLYAWLVQASAKCVHRALRPAPFIYTGICDLFELYLVHVFVAFSDVSLGSILQPERSMVMHSTPYADA